MWIFPYKCFRSNTNNLSRVKKGRCCSHCASLSLFYVILLMAALSPWLKKVILLEILWNNLSFNTKGDNISSLTLPLKATKPKSSQTVEWNTATRTLNVTFNFIIKSVITLLICQKWQMLITSLKGFFKLLILSDQQSKNLKHLIYNDIETSHLTIFKVTILKMFIISTYYIGFMACIF